MSGDNEGRKGVVNFAVLYAAALVLVLLLCGCGGGGGAGGGGGGTTGGGGGGTGSGPVGSLFAFSDFQNATRSVPGYADTLRITITPPAGVVLPGTIANPISLTRSSTSRVLNGLTADEQPYVLDMEALTAGTVVGTAQRNIVITADTIAEVDVSANLESAIDSIEVEGLSSRGLGQGQYIAHARDSNGSTLFSGSGFRFSSSNPTVLSINPDTGIAEARAQGAATVTALLSGTTISGQLDVTVVEFPKIAFVSRGDPDTGNTDIYVMNVDGSEQTRLTTASAADAQPSFSPDGTKIAFISYRDVHSEIYIMNADGTEQTRLTYFLYGVRDPAFSPDGSKIVFSYYEGGPNNDIYVMNSDGSGLTNLTNSPDWEVEPSYSPDGSKIVYTADYGQGNEIYVMNADGSGRIRLTNNTDYDGVPVFSPDGSKIVYCSGSPIINNSNIYIMNADGSGRTILTNHPARDMDPTFNSDGSKIAFSSDRYNGEDDIFTMNVNGTGVQRLTYSPLPDNDPSFAPSGG